MSIDIQIDYEQVEEMEQLFRQYAEEISNTLSTMESIASNLESGALEGLTGDAMVHALRNQLKPSLNCLIEKFQEMAGDLDAVVQFYRDGVESARQKFL